MIKARRVVSNRLDKSTSLSVKRVCLIWLINNFVQWGRAVLRGLFAKHRPKVTQEQHIHPVHVPFNPSGKFNHEISRNYLNGTSSTGRVGGETISLRMGIITWPVEQSWQHESRNEACVRPLLHGYRPVQEQGQVTRWYTGARKRVNFKTKNKKITKEEDGGGEWKKWIRVGEEAEGGGEGKEGGRGGGGEEKGSWVLIAVFLSDNRLGHIKQWGVLR